MPSIGSNVSFDDTKAIRFSVIAADSEEETVVDVTIFQIIVDVTTIIKTVNIQLNKGTKRRFDLLSIRIGGDNFERRGGDDWGRGGSSRGESRDGDRPDPPVRQNDRWQEPDKRENSNYGGKWKEDRGGNSRGKIS